MVAKYPCVLSDKNFFVWIASTKIAYFDKSTFMNVANFAEAQGATDLYLLISSDNPQIKSYKCIFKVIDAERVKAHELQLLLNKNLKAKTVVAETLFFRVNL